MAMGPVSGGATDGDAVAGVDVVGGVVGANDSPGKVGARLDGAEVGKAVGMVVGDAEGSVVVGSDVVGSEVVGSEVGGSEVGGSEVGGSVNSDVVTGVWVDDAGSVGLPLLPAWVVGGGGVGGGVVGGEVVGGGDGVGGGRVGGSVRNRSQLCGHWEL